MYFCIVSLALFCKCVFFVLKVFFFLKFIKFFTDIFVVNAYKYVSCV